MNPDDEDLRHWDAAYVLGALTPEDRLAYETYLADHPERAADVSDIAGIPGLLKRLPLASAIALTEPSESPSAGSGPGPGLARAMRKRRRLLRAGFAATVSGVAAAALLVGVLIASPHPTAFPSAGVTSAPATPTSMTSARAHTITADLVASGKPWGTSLDVNCSYSPRWASPAKTFDLVVTAKNGTKTTAATWTAAGSTAKGITAATGIPLDQISRVEIRDAKTDLLLASTRP
jgi:anti-sigma factor RsiW